MSEKPERIGDYQIEGELGTGGMATVYRARHLVLDTVHAIKVLDPSYRVKPEARRRFLDEARIQAKHLDHPNIVKVTNIVATAEHAALVMELASGGSLERQVGALKQRPDEIKRIMLAVLDAVGHAHAAGVIHRDLKPANVLLQRKGDRLVPKVTDFGIAKVTAELAGQGKRSTHGDARMGTLSYMSPEQVRRSKDVTPRSDIFSLGAMLYELATGEVPFGGESDYDVMENVVNGRYQPPELRFPGIDPVLAAVIRRALEPDPARRFASCEEMAAALRGEREVSPPVGGGVTAAAPAPALAARSSGYRTALLAGLALAGVAFGAGAVLVATRGDDDKPSSGSGSGSQAGGQGGAADAATGARKVASGAAVPWSSDARTSLATAAQAAMNAQDEPDVPAVPLVPVAAAAIFVPAARRDAGVSGNARLAELTGAAQPAPGTFVPLLNPCRKTWFAGDEVTIAITGKTAGNCGEYYFYDRSRGYPVRTCKGVLTGCRVSGQTVTAGYDCLFSKTPFETRKGTFKLTCGGGRLTATSAHGAWTLR